MEGRLSRSFGDHVGAVTQAFASRQIASGRTPLLHEIFEATVDLHPEGIAITHGEERVTYAALERRANRLAHVLHRRGVPSRSLVGLLLPRSIDAYVAMLAILKAGCAYVPIDPELPDERIRFVLNDSGATALVMMAAIGARLAPFRGPTILVDADRDWIEAASSARPSRSVTRTGPRDLCYVIYTSGSTGRPKGVMIGLYDTVMGDGACLDALSLLMKGESLPAGTAWAGVPAAPAHAAVWAAA